MQDKLGVEVADGKVSDQEVSKVIRETSGIYRDVDVDGESRKLRAEPEKLRKLIKDI